MGISLAFLCVALGQTAALEGISQKAIEEAYARVTPAVVQIKFSTEILNPNSGEASRRSGDALGLLITADGLVMTHGHMVIENRTPFNVKVLVGEGEAQREFEATLLRKPEDINVAFLTINVDDGTRFPYVRFTEGVRLGIGEPVFVIGVMTEPFDYARSVQTRRVGAVLSAPRTTYVLDEPVSFGYVGGPVFDARGRAIGVIGFDLAASEGGELYTRSGQPLIYQAELFSAYVETPPGDDAASDGDAWLGVFTQPLTDDLAEYWQLPKSGGVVVSTVIPGSPAEQMGLQTGDVVVGFNGAPVAIKQDSEVRVFTKMIRDSPIGQPLPVNVYRDGEPKELTLTLTTRPTSSRDAAEFEDTVFGLTVRELTTDVRIALNIASDVKGVIVRQVKSGSAANQAQIRPGFVILRIGEADIASVDDFKKTVEQFKISKPAEITVFCRVGANTAFFRMQPRWDSGN